MSDDLEILTRANAAMLRMLEEITPRIEESGTHIQSYYRAALYAADALSECSESAKYDYPEEYEALRIWHTVATANMRRHFDKLVWRSSIETWQRARYLGRPSEIHLN